VGVRPGDQLIAIDGLPYIEWGRSGHWRDFRSGHPNRYLFEDREGRRFAVDLEEAGSPLLRRNRRVDVLVITGVRADAVRLRRGPFARAGGPVQDVFVVEGDHAVRRQVALGLSGRDFLEIVQGLEPGEQVIVSDMTDYLHLERVQLR